MSRTFLALLLAFVPAICWAAELKLIGEAKEHHFAQVESDQVGKWLILGPNAAVVLESTQLGGTPVLGAPRLNRAPVIITDGGKVANFVGPRGWYAVTQWVDAEPEPSVLVVEIVGAGPRPPPVDPLDPVDPDPIVTPPPLPLAEMRVLILNESEPPSFRTPAERAIWQAQQLGVQSPKVQDYLTAKCVKVGTKAEWRIADPDAPFANMPKPWQDIRLKANPTASPWVVVEGSSGVVFNGPYPATEAAALEFFKKYGGP